jgi:hypothetical protein
VKKSLYFLCFSFLIYSCRSNKVSINIYDRPEIEEREVLGSNLKNFFKNHPQRIETFSVKSNKIQQEFLLIKNKIQINNNILDPFDDGSYKYCFINKKDTLFADSRLGFWKFKSKGIAYTLNGKIKNTLFEIIAK